MAATNPDVQVTWSAASSVTLSSTARVDSDALTLNAADGPASVQISADNSGTPSAGDVLNVYAKYTNGDILGDTGDDYDTNKGATFLGQLDTYSTNGEDPIRRTYDLRSFGKKGVKISVDAPQGGVSGRNIVVRARIVTNRQQ